MFRCTGKSYVLLEAQAEGSPVVQNDTIYETIITIDEYDAPFWNASSEQHAVVEVVIRDLFYDQVLAAWGGFSYSGRPGPKLVVMGRGIEDYHAPAQNLRAYTGLSLVDYTFHPYYLGVLGLTQREVDAALEFVTNDLQRMALRQKILESCWRVSFNKQSTDRGGILCSREVASILDRFLQI